MHVPIGENVGWGREGEGKGAICKVLSDQPRSWKTAFTGFMEADKSPEEAAEVVVKLLADEEGTYPGGTFWERNSGEMREVLGR